MFKNLIERALEDGISHITIGALIQNEKNQILLIEKRLSEISGKKEYEIPVVELKKGESIPQALQRAIMLNTGMNLSEVVTFLGHFDGAEKKSFCREYVFVVKVSDPYVVEEEGGIGHAWVQGEDGVGYPIADSLRDTLDLFIRFLKKD